MKRWESAAALCLLCSCTGVVECELARHASSGDAGTDGAVADAGAVDAGGFCPFDAGDYDMIQLDTPGGMVYPREISNVGQVTFHGGTPDRIGESTFAFEIPDSGIVDFGVAHLSDIPYASSVQAQNVPLPLSSLSLTARHPSVTNADMAYTCAVGLMEDQNLTWTLVPVEPYCMDGGGLPDLPTLTSSVASIGWSPEDGGTLGITAGALSYRGPEVVSTPDGGTWTSGSQVSFLSTVPLIIEAIAIDGGPKWIIAGPTLNGGYGSQVFEPDFTPYLPPLVSSRELRPVPYTSDSWVVGTFDAGNLELTFWDGGLRSGNVKPAYAWVGVGPSPTDVDSLQGAAIDAGLVRFTWTSAGHVSFVDVNVRNPAALNVRSLCTPEPTVYAAPLDQIHVLVKGASGTLRVRLVGP